MLIGRQNEQQRIAEALAEARAGRSRALLLHGEAGIGKTALLNEAVERADGMRVLRAQGNDSEAELAYSGLLELLRPVLGKLEAIPARQATALRTALALAEGRVDDPFAVAGATLSILAAVSEEAPLLVIVDDVHWLDSASTQALLFAARRLAADPVALLFAEREGEGHSIARAGLDELLLSGLDDESAAELLRQSGRAAPAPEVARDLIRTTGGNPLALRELPQFLTSEELTGTSPIREPLPTSAAIEQAFTRRAAALPLDTRALILIAAALGTGELSVIVRAASGSGLDPASLEAAESAGLVVVARDELHFVHPLARSAFYQMAAPGDRRAAHRALAQALLGEGTSDQRAWQRAAAALEPDEDIASALEESAQRAQERSGYAAASAALERAAELSPSESSKARRLLAAGHTAILAGAGDRAFTLLERALEQATDPDTRAEIQIARGRIAFFRGEVDLAYEILAAEAARLEPIDSPAAAALYGMLVPTFMQRGDPTGALAVARRSLELAEQDEASGELIANLFYGIALIYAGRAREGRRYVERAGTILEQDPGRFDVSTLAGPVAVTLLLIGDERGEPLLRRLAAEARAAGSFGVLGWLVGVLSICVRERGDWPAARALAAEALEVARDTGQQLNLADALIEVAALAALQGREAECRAAASEVLALPSTSTSLTSRVAIQATLGVLELGIGRLDAAIARLEPPLAEVRQRGVAHPDVVEGAPDLVEAYVRSGRRADADELLPWFEELAENSELSYLLGPASRCRGLLAAEEDYEASFGEALAQCKRGGLAFEEARTELCLGERLRRSSRRIEARTHLRRALATFERLAAAPWAERARTELRASGETIRRREPAARDELTPQELKVALVIAQGVSNREAGASLFLSPKTIEFHLGRVYRKLGIRSRAELVRLFAEQQAASVTPLDDRLRPAASR